MKNLKFLTEYAAGFTITMISIAAMVFVIFILLYGFCYVIGFALATVFEIKIIDPANAGFLVSAVGSILIIAARFGWNMFMKIRKGLLNE